ncbi:Imm21 family immunity protein [Streptomyces collinus]|uniref:Imm21 family immunity protein n=1 Tax=Streptomyces collinus TaxID=42684 RepID=UPI00362BD0B6
MARHGDPGAVRWVESGGGPLVAVPETVLPFWTGADSEELDTDYDRACEVGGRVGLLPVGDSAALVLGDEPAATSYLPDLGTFVRRPAGRPERELPVRVPAALDAAVWEGELRWNVPGPVVLFDSARPGAAARTEGHLRVPLEPGPYLVRAGHLRPDPQTWIGLVRLSRPAP